MKRLEPTEPLTGMINRRKQFVLSRTASAAARLESGPIGNIFFKRHTQMALDASVGMLSLLVSYLLRFDGWPPDEYAFSMLLIMPFTALARVMINYLYGVYARVWRYTSIADALRLAIAGGMVSTILLVLRVGLSGTNASIKLPISVIVIDYLLTCVGLLGVRLLRRLTHESAVRVTRQRPVSKQRVLLVGAGDAGVMTVKEITRRPDLGVEICGFVDDDPKKQRAVIQSIRVLGGIPQLPELIRREKIGHVIISMASAPRKVVRQVLEICKAAGVSVKIIPGLYEILGGDVTVTDIRPVEIEDLLGRDTINLNAWFDSIRDAYAGKRILITGAGGSIGRELCRQLLVLNPGSLILVDKDENSVFEIEQELKMLLVERNIELSPTICDMRQVSRLEKIFERHLPDVVFHAAAHKHVPLMEHNPCEAVLNNIIGTATLLKVCERFETRQCVMVSTDKAVNPTSIMGATKRVAELMFQAQAQRLSGKCQYSCVRFGNVLGSRGSVVASFREQIKRGGPVTVTHPDMVRYFMTIPEAAQLIVQAGALGEKGEIFLLDMGEPVKVLDLARDMIQLSGLQLGEDIDIEFCGLRPGEKLKEELLIAEEGAQATQYQKIFVAPPIAYDAEQLDFWVRSLEKFANDGDEEAVYNAFSEMDIRFHSRERHGAQPDINEIKSNPQTFRAPA